MTDNKHISLKDAAGKAASADDIVRQVFDNIILIRHALAEEQHGGFSQDAPETLSENFAKQTTEKTGAQDVQESYIFKEVPDYQACVTAYETLCGRDDLDEQEQGKLIHLKNTIELMDDIIGEIDINDSASLNKIGAAAFENMAAISQDILKRTERDGLFADEINDIRKAMENIDWDDFNEQTQQWVRQQDVDPNEQADGTMGKLYKGPLGGLFAGLGIKSARKTREIDEVIKDGVISDRQIEEKLRTTSLKLNKLRVVLNEAEYKIPYQVARLRKLAQIRLDAHQRLSVHIAAAKEKQRRVEDQDAPAWQERLNDSDSVMLREEHDEFLYRYDRLTKRIRNMEESRAVFLISTQGLLMMKHGYDDAFEQVRVHKEETLPEWSATLKQVAQLLRLAELEEAIEEAETLTEKTVKKNEMMSENAVKRAKSKSLSDQELDRALKAINKNARQLEILKDHTQRLRLSKENVEGKLIDGMGALTQKRAENLTKRVLKLEHQQAAARKQLGFHETAHDTETAQEKADHSTKKTPVKAPQGRHGL